MQPDTSIILLFTAFRQKEANRAEASNETQGHPTLIFLRRYEGKKTGTRQFSHRDRHLFQHA